MADIRVSDENENANVTDAKTDNTKAMEKHTAPVAEKKDATQGGEKKEEPIPGGLVTRGPVFRPKPRHLDAFAVISQFRMEVETFARRSASDENMGVGSFQFERMRKGLMRFARLH